MTTHDPDRDDPDWRDDWDALLDPDDVPPPAPRDPDHAPLPRWARIVTITDPEGRL